LDESFQSDESGPGAEGRCGVLVRVSDDVRRQLKIVAIHRGLSVQALLLEAITEILEQPNHHPKR
jgi:hypothetical protein